jgi:hypothetical protein
MTPDSYTILLFGMVNIGILLLAIGMYRKIKALQAELENISINVGKSEN